MPEKNHTTNATTNSTTLSDVSANLPPIPDKRYFTIGEAAVLCGLKPHVLRYWEQEFTTLKPIKRRGNRRFYQYKDVLMIRQIRKLLYDDGYTIEGARAQLLQIPANLSKATQSMDVVQNLIADLEALLESLKK